MGQFNWTYLGDNGKKFDVGLFHGARTGHLLIHCNKKVVQIDFNVRDSKTYSFFIEEELCEIEIERKENKFSYEFHINQQVDTPRNRERKKREKKYWKQSLIFFGLILSCACLFAFGFIWHNSSVGEQEINHLLASNGQETLAKVFLKSEGEEGIEFNYSFVANGNSYQSDIIQKNSILLEHGMPLESGDEFVVRYVQGRPNLHEIHLNQPSKEQVERYWQRSFDRHKSLHPSFPNSRINCYLSTAFEVKGIAGLADFYFQETDQAINPKHNNLSYLRLIRDVPFQKLTKEKCL